MFNIEALEIKRLDRDHPPYNRLLVMIEDILVECQSVLQNNVPVFSNSLKIFGSALDLISDDYFRQINEKEKKLYELCHELSDVLFHIGIDLNSMSHGEPTFNLELPVHKFKYYVMNNWNWVVENL